MVLSAELLVLIVFAPLVLFYLGLKIRRARKNQMAAMMGGAVALEVAGTHDVVPLELNAIDEMITLSLLPTLSVLYVVLLLMI